ncbi:hypothetical protein ACH5RR_040971 [Cinchona calisaya]|uniref:Uncharacterized protein n=1 Tax=Cinchona calisaya TaxID=153742 RepID=A0ABD2XSQ8_9GENT
MPLSSLSTALEDLKVAIYVCLNPFDFPNYNPHANEKVMDLITSVGMPYEKYVARDSPDMASKYEALSSAQMKPCSSDAAKPTKPLA